MEILCLIGSVTFFLILFLWMLLDGAENSDNARKCMQSAGDSSIDCGSSHASRGGGTTERTYKHLILVEVPTYSKSKSPIPTVSLQRLILVGAITKNDHKYDLIDLHAHGGALALYCCMYIIRSDHQAYTSMVDGRGASKLSLLCTATGNERLMGQGNVRTTIALPPLARWSPRSIQIYPCLCSYLTALFTAYRNCQ